jgi:hypothetical protein
MVDMAITQIWFCGRKSRSVNKFSKCSNLNHLGPYCECIGPNIDFWVHIGECIGSCYGPPDPSVTQGIVPSPRYIQCSDWTHMFIILSIFNMPTRHGNALTIYMYMYMYMYMYILLFYYSLYIYIYICLSVFIYDRGLWTTAPRSSPHSSHGMVMSGGIGRRPHTPHRHTHAMVLRIFITPF